MSPTIESASLVSIDWQEKRGNTLTIELPKLHIDSLVLEDAFRADKLELHSALAEQSILVEHIPSFQQRQMRFVECILQLRLGMAWVAESHRLQKAKLDHLVRLSRARFAIHETTAAAVVLAVEQVELVAAQRARVDELILHPSRRMLVPSEDHCLLHTGGAPSPGQTCARARVALAAEQIQFARTHLLLAHVNAVVVRGAAIGWLEAAREHRAETRHRAGAARVWNRRHCCSQTFVSACADRQTDRQADGEEGGEAACDGEGSQRGREREYSLYATARLANRTPQHLFLLACFFMEGRKSEPSFTL